MNGTITARLRAAAAGLAFAGLLAACASSPSEEEVEAARRANTEFLQRQGAALAAEHAGKFLVVQGGDLAAESLLPDDAVRVAARRDPSPVHRFVFRPEDAGERLYRMTFLPEGGRVAGKAVFDALGLRVQLLTGSGVMIGRPGRPWAFGASPEGRLAIEVRSLDREHAETIEVAVDPEFDGGLLLDAETAARFGLDRDEIPGVAEVQVALSRPFAARRSLVLVSVPQVSASGVAEALVETLPAAPAK